MIKWIFAGLAACLVVYLLAIAWTLNAYRFKVIDPDAPGFKAENFRFEDYFLDKDIDERKVRDAMFPPGTDREYVENILVKKAGASAMDYTIYTLEKSPVRDATVCMRYDYVPWWNPAYKIFGLLNGVMFDGARFGIHVYYDDNGKVVEVH